ncbi:MAG: TetR/AcrR family transcriptional regulator [Bilophila wadsworthia]
METKGIAPATPATERRQRTPLAVTRERVLGIAEQMFRQSGVQAVSVDAIAQAAGIKKMTLYRCFPSKEELVMACMDQWEAAFRRIWDQAQDQYPNESARQLLAFFQSIYELVSQPGYSGNVFMHLMTDYTDPEHHICARVREQRALARTWEPAGQGGSSTLTSLPIPIACCLKGFLPRPGPTGSTAGLSATPPPSPKKRFAKAAAPVRSRPNRAGSAAGRSASQETLFLVKNGFAPDVPDAKPFSRVYAFTKVKNANAKKICFSYLLYRRRVVL